MIDRRKNTKDFASIVYETYKDFAENTSIHGLKYTVKRDVAVYEKIFWMVVVLAGLCGAGYMTVLFWNRYTSNPTRTSIKTAYAPNTAVPFPAVTLCNINRIMADQVDDLVETLTIPEDKIEIVKRAIPQLLAFVSVETRKYNMTELMILHNVLIDNKHDDIAFIMQEVMQPCENMILKCMWEFEVVPCGDLFETTLTTDGFCCSFNYVREYNKPFAVQGTFNEKRQVRHTPFNGFNAGLRLHIDPEIQEVQYSTLHSSGLKVMVHSPGDYPGSGTIYKIVSAGRRSYLQITGSRIDCSPDIKSLPIEQRQCTYNDEVKLKYFKFYSDTNCLSECEEKYLYARCGCVPFYYPFSNRRVCNITSIPCLEESIGTTLVDVSKSCNCPSQCEDIFYSVLSSTASLGGDEAAYTSDFLLDQNVTEDTIALHVYFSGHTQTILYKDIITSTIYLLSSFGGVYSLFLGCSFITVIEILYYCTLRLIVNLKIVGRIDKTAVKSKLEDSKPQNQKLWTYEGSIYLN